jgi:hypothetical protein
MAAPIAAAGWHPRCSQLSLCRQRRPAEPVIGHAQAEPTLSEPPPWEDWPDTTDYADAQAIHPPRGTRCLCPSPSSSARFAVFAGA